jgi:hypothetical protein
MFPCRGWRERQLPLKLGSTLKTFFGGWFSGKGRCMIGGGQKKIVLAKHIALAWYHSRKLSFEKAGAGKLSLESSA